jgi:hypothetical protein
MNETELPDLIEHSFVRTQETANYERNTANKNWEAIRDECVSGGAMDSRCNIVAASLGKGHLEVVSQRLSCGCVLVPAEGDEAII